MSRFRWAAGALIVSVGCAIGSFEGIQPARAAQVRVWEQPPDLHGLRDADEGPEAEHIVTLADLEGRIVQAGDRALALETEAAEAAGEEPRARLVAFVTASFRRPVADPVRRVLANGAMAHALDFDDSHPSLRGHPSATLVPAARAYADGRQLLVGRH